MRVKTETSIFNPPSASADERAVAQWLFEASLVSYNGNANADVRRIAHERPDAMLITFLFLAIDAGLIFYPSEAAI